jgi:hypothetical protein
MWSRRNSPVSNWTSIDNRRRSGVGSFGSPIALRFLMPYCMLARVDPHLAVDTILQGRLARLGRCCRLCFVSSFLLLELPVGRGLWDHICKKLEIGNASNCSGLERSALQPCVVREEDSPISLYPMFLRGLRSDLTTLYACSVK